MDNLIIVSILGMGGLGFVFAAILAIADEKLKVKEDPRVAEIEILLPRVNCGACGFINCHTYAVNLANNAATIDKCRVGGEDLQKRLSVLLGIQMKAVVKKIAVVHCAADSSIRKSKARYSGVDTCSAKNLLKGDELLCDYGCLGSGDCKIACPFDAIEMVSGLPKINPDKCVACGKCISACPRNIISVGDLDHEGGVTYVACRSLDKGAVTRKTCSAGCIACGLCQKLSDGAFLIEENLARPDYKKIKTVANINDILIKCPTKVIKTSGISHPASRI